MINAVIIPQNILKKKLKESVIISALKKPNEVKEYNLINATKEQIAQKIQNGFSTKEREFYVLGKTSIFGSEKRLILSSDTIKSHTHHENIAAADYAKIKYILGQKLHAYNSKTDTRKMAILLYIIKIFLKQYLKTYQIKMRFLLSV